MSKSDIIRVTRNAGDPSPKGRTDWKRVDSLSDGDARRAALSDSDALPMTRAQLARMRRVPQAKSLRRRLGMTQVEFAAAFHLPISTLRDWEQRRSIPDAPARALLLAIERDPRAMQRLLADSAA